MRSLIAITVTLLSICHRCDAQFMKAIRGDRVQYDTAMIIEAPTYRKLRSKIQAADALSAAFQRSRAENLVLQKAWQREREGYEAKALDDASTIAAERKSNKEAALNFKDLDQTYKKFRIFKGTKWIDNFADSATKFLIGAAVGGGATLILVK